MKTSQIITKKMLAEQAMRQDPVYQEFARLGIILKESALTQNQIKQVFKQVADGAAAGGNVDKEGDAPASNRTLIGKGADVASSISNAFGKVKQYIGNSGPIKGVDAAVDTAQQQIMAAAGGESGKVGQALEWYRELMKVPGMGMAAKAIILGLAALSGAGLGGAALVGGIAFVDRMLQGDEFSSAIWSGVKGGATAAALGAAHNAYAGTPTAATPDGAASVGNTTAHDMDMMTQPQAPADQIQLPPADQIQLPDADAASNGQADIDAAQDWINADAAGKAQIEQTTGMSGAQLQDIAVGNDLKPADVGNVSNYDDGTAGNDSDLQPYTVMQGETLSQIAKSNGVSVKDIMDANPDITDPNKISAGQQIQIPHETGNPVYDKGVGLGGNKNSPSFYNDDMAKIQQPAAGKIGALDPGIAPLDPNGQPMRPVPFDQDAVNGVVKGDVTLPDGTVLRPKMAPNVQESIIDEALTVRMWALNESRGRHGRRPIYVTESGRQLIFKMIARQYQLDEGALDKLKAFNKGAANKISKFTAPIKKAAAAGWDSATNKITYQDLERGWRRSAKLAGEDSVDSEQVKTFLRSRGVKDPLINSVFAQLNIPSETPSVDTKQTPGTPAAPTSTTAAAADAMGLDPRFGDALRARAGTGIRTKQTPGDTQTVAVPSTTPAVAKAKTQTQTQTVPTPAKTATTQIPTTPAANPVTKTTTMTVPASKATTPAVAKAKTQTQTQTVPTPAKTATTQIPTTPAANPVTKTTTMTVPASKATTPVPAAKTTTTANAGKFVSRGIPGLDAQQAAYQKSPKQVPVEESIDLAEALWRKMKSKQ